jgi:hypothetical protein
MFDMYFAELLARVPEQQAQHKHQQREQGQETLSAQQLERGQEMAAHPPQGHHRYTHKGRIHPLAPKFGTCSAELLEQALERQREQERAKERMSPNTLDPASNRCGLGIPHL